jgi:hypothetical protein
MLTEFPDVSDWQVETRGNEGVGFSLLQIARRRIVRPAPSSGEDGVGRRRIAAI